MAIERGRSDEGGFSLVELLVVVVILGVLAGIAIPRFLSQRDRAGDAVAMSDVRTMSKVQYARLAGTGSFAPDLGGLEDEGWRPTEGTQPAVCVSGSGHTARFIVASRYREGTVVVLRSDTQELVSTSADSVDAAMAAVDPTCSPVEATPDSVDDEWETLPDGSKVKKSPPPKSRRGDA